ncbi:MAG: alkaline phosphatase [Muribaculaceae bacterium]|nr:alkaline phosphatase [Muribaculaceae bacterium]
MKIKSLLLTLLLVVSLAVNATSPKYVFYFIGDGMGMGHIMAAQSYNREVLKNNQPILMMQFPVASMVTTYSASSRVTDSAAAGTALSTGYKTNNGMLGVTPDSVPVTSVARYLKDAGWGIGVITTVAPDDATPGAFYAHQPNRSMAYEIDKEMAASGYEFVAGSKLRGTKDKAGNPTDIYSHFAQNNVAIVKGIDALKDVDSRRVVLLNKDSLDSNVGYTIDSIEGALTLPAMTQACLDHLTKHSPDQFFMMVEGGNIDYAGHSNDGGAVVKEVLNFNDAIKIAYDFYLAHPDKTLIVVTADHNTGGMSVRFGDISLVDCQRMSKDRFAGYTKSLLNSRRIYTWEDMKTELSNRFGFWNKIKISKEQETKLVEKFETTFNLRNSADQKTLYNSFDEFAVEVFNIINTKTGFGWIATGHTGDPVPLFAIGRGAYEFMGVHDNTEIPKIIKSITLGE